MRGWWTLYKVTTYHTLTYIVWSPLQALVAVSCHTVWAFVGVQKIMTAGAYCWDGVWMIPPTRFSMPDLIAIGQTIPSIYGEPPETLSSSIAPPSGLFKVTEQTRIDWVPMTFY